MIKVLHITTLTQGGAARATIRLHQSLLDHGVDSNLLYLRGNSQEGITKAYQFRPKKRLRSNTLLARVWKKIGLDRKTIDEKNKIRLKELRKIGVFDIFTFPQTDHRLHTHEKVQEADIIHLHWVADFLDWSSFFKNIKKPIVWTFHDRNPFLGGVHLETDYYRNSEAFQSIDKTYRLIKTKAIKEVSQLHIVSPSPSLATETASRAIFKSYEITVIPNSTEESIFTYKDQHIAKEAIGYTTNDILILYVGSHAYHKGFDILLESVNELNNTHFTFLIAGVDTTKIKHEKIPTNITFLGSIQDDQYLATLYSAVDSTIITSREDNLPNVMLESWFCGAPVLAVPVGGMKDSIIPLKNGMLSRDTSANAIVQMINEFDTNKASFNRKEISKKAREKYSSKRQVSAYTKLYNEITGTK